MGHWRALNYWWSVAGGRRLNVAVLGTLSPSAAKLRPLLRVLRANGARQLDTGSREDGHTPNVNNPAAQSLLEVGANGAVCNLVSQVTCFAPEWAAVNYTEKQLSKHDYMSIRNEAFDDLRGQRTGFRTLYTEHAIGWAHWVGTTVLFRPELRYERAYDTLVYDNATRKNQFMFASDVIFFF